MKVRVIFSLTLLCLYPQSLQRISVPAEFLAPAGRKVVVVATLLRSGEMLEMEVKGPRPD